MWPTSRQDDKPGKVNQSSIGNHCQVVRPTCDDRERNQLRTAPAHSAEPGTAARGTAGLERMFNLYIDSGLSAHNQHLVWASHFRLRRSMPKAASLFLTMSDIEHIAVMDVIGHLARVGVPVTMPRLEPPASNIVSIDHPAREALAIAQRALDGLQAIVDHSHIRQDFTHDAFLSTAIRRRSLQVALLSRVVAVFDPGQAGTIEGSISRIVLRIHHELMGGQR